jgi:hypothetical protein
MGAPILVEPSQRLSNPIEIALKELEIGILPMTIRRTLPDETFQDIPLKWFLPIEQSTRSQKNRKN